MYRKDQFVMVNNGRSTLGVVLGPGDQGLVRVRRFVKSSRRFTNEVAVPAASLRSLNAAERRSKDVQAARDAFALEAR